MKNTHLILYFLLSLSLFTGCVTEHKTIATNDSKSCAIIDTDFGIDDLRAISLILPRYDYTLLVATEGITRTPYGVKIGERFLQSVIGHYNGDVFEGKSSTRPQKNAALNAGRESLEAMNGFLPARIPSANSNRIADESFKQQVASCQQVNVFLLAPYTSFHTYKNILPTDTKVFAYGTFPSPKNKHLGFNCEYDTASCFALAPAIKKFDMKFFKLSPKYSYYLTPNEIGKLKETDLEKLIKDIHNANFSTWDNSNTQMWGDAVALYLYAPDKFQNKGRQFYPKMKPEQFRASWTQAFEKISQNTKPSLVN